MRITNSMIANNFRKSVQRATKDLSKYQQRVSSGLFANKPSDDPARANRILSIRTSISKNEQYIFNSDNSEALLGAASGVYDEVTEILTRAHELAHTALSGSTDKDSLQFFATEVEQLIESVVGSGNAEFAGTYLFAGNETDRPPFVMNRAESVTEVNVAEVLEDHDYITIGENTDFSVGDEVSIENANGEDATAVITKIDENPEENVVKIYLSELDPEFIVSEDSTILKDNISEGIISSYVNRDHLDGYLLMNIDDIRRIKLEADETILIRDNNQEIRAIVDEIGEPDVATGEVRVYLKGIEPDMTISSNATVVHSHTEERGKILSVDYRGDSGLHSERVGKDIYITTNTPGDLVYERIFEQLINLRDAFESGATEEIDVLYQGIQDSIMHIANLQTEVGVKMQRVDTTRNRLKDMNASLSIFLEKIEQVDITDAITDLTMQENVLNATLSSGARVLTPTLFNYM